MQFSKWEKYITDTYAVKPIDDYKYLSVLLQAYELQDKGYIDYALSGNGYTASDVYQYCASAAFSSEKDIANTDIYFASEIINTLLFTESEADETQKRIAELALDYENYTKNGISAKGGYCLKFSNDILKAAGMNIKRTDCANCAGTYFGVSNDFSKIPIGAEIYCYSSQQYGHVGIYIGNGFVIHCNNYKNSKALQNKIILIDESIANLQNRFSYMTAEELSDAEQQILSMTSEKNNALAETDNNNKTIKKYQNNISELQTKLQGV